MKTIKNIILMASAMIAAACSSEVLTRPDVSGQEAELFDMTFEAYLGTDTKTSLAESGKVQWKEGDKISVFAAGGNYEFTATAFDETTGKATFQGQAPEASEYAALYPYNSKASYINGVFGMEYPSVQTATEGSFDPQSELTISLTADQTFYFSHVGALLGFTLKDEGIKSVTFSADQSFAGRINADLSTGTPSFDVVSGTAGVSLEGDFRKDTKYWVCVLPGEYTNIKVQLVDAQGRLGEVNASRPLSVKRAHAITIGALSATEWLSSYYLDGSAQVQAFIDGKGDTRETVNDLIVTGADVTGDQIIKLKNRVERVKGTLKLSGVLADEWESTGNCWFESEHVFYNESGNGQNAIHCEGNIVVENIPCNINPNGLRNTQVIGGDLVLRNIAWPFDWNAFDSLLEVKGDLILDHITKTLNNFKLPKLVKVGGDLVVNDCDNGFWNISEMGDNFVVGGNLVLTGNGQAFTYPDWRTGFYKFALIGGDVTIVDNAIDNKAAQYCFVRDLYQKGVISPSATVTLGSSQHGLIDFATVSGCQEPDPEDNPKDLALSGYQQVQDFLDKSSDKITVLTLTVSGADVTVEQMHKLQDRIGEVRGDLVIDGVCTDDPTTDWLDTRKIVAMNPKKGLIFLNMRHTVNPNGLANYAHVHGDLKFIDCDWNLDGGWAEASLGQVTQIDGDLVVSNLRHKDHLWRGQFFNKLQTVGGDIIIEQMHKSYITMDALTEVGGDLIIRDCEKEMFSGSEDGLFALKKVGGDLRLENLSYGSNYLTLDLLTEIGGDLVIDGVNANMFSHSSAFFATGLKSVGGSVIIKNIAGTISKDTNNAFASLRTVGGDFQMLGVGGLKRFFDTRDGEKYGLCLKSLGGSLVIKDCAAFKSFTGFDHLESIGGDVIVTGNETSWVAQTSDIKNIGFCIIKEYVESGVIKAGANVQLQQDLSGLSACSKHFDAPDDPEPGPDPDPDPDPDPTNPEYGWRYVYGTANCHIAYNTSSISFPVSAYRINPDTYEWGEKAQYAPAPASAKLIWRENTQTYNNITKRLEGRTVEVSESITMGISSSISVSLSTVEGEPVVTVSNISGKGNALVGIYDANDNLLWSYHIWVPESDPTADNIVYTSADGSQSFTMMPMYLGALKAVKAYTSGYECSGLMYQWGRKDPMGRPRSVSIKETDGTWTGSGSSSYINTSPDAAWNSNIVDAPLSSDVLADCIAAGKTPTTWYKASSDDKSWVSAQVNLWSANTKTVFDPSPAGYVVAPIDVYRSFALSSGDSPVFVNDNGFGYVLYEDDTQAAVKDYYAKNACRLSAGNAVSYYDMDSYNEYIWSANSNSNSTAWRLARGNYGTKGKSCGYAVRCVKFATQGGSEGKNEDFDKENGQW